MSVAWGGPSDTATSSGGFNAWQRELAIATLVCSSPEHTHAGLWGLPLGELAGRLPPDEPVRWFVTQPSTGGSLDVDQCTALARRLNEILDTLLRNEASADNCLDTVDWLRNEFATASERGRPIRWG
ncbi:MAG TPA: hypothetical protein PKD86_09660 [Gemmatales bacterium]|nr:hypothetical protein [Gemmatales bacterium]